MLLVNVMAHKHAAALPQAGSLGAGKVNLPVAGHEQLHGLELRIVGGKGSTLMHKFVREVLNGVAK